LCLLSVWDIRNYLLFNSCFVDLLDEYSNNTGGVLVGVIAMCQRLPYYFLRKRRAVNKMLNIYPIVIKMTCTDYIITCQLPNLSTTQQLYRIVSITKFIHDTTKNRVNYQIYPRHNNYGTIW